MFINVKTVKFSIVDSLNPKYVEVLASFTYDGKMCHHYIFITKRSDYKEKDYLIEARKIFLGDVKRNRINVKKKVSPVLIGAASFFAVATLALAGVLTYQYLKPGDNPGPQPEPQPTKDVNIILDEGTKAKMDVEPLTATTDKDYCGVITLKNNDEGLIANDVKVTVDGKSLTIGTDYTIDYVKGQSHQYSIRVLRKGITGDLNISASTGNKEDFKTNGESFIKAILLKDLYNIEINKSQNLDNVYNTLHTLYKANLVHGKQVGSGIASRESYYSRSGLDAKSFDTYSRNGSTNMYRHEEVTIGTESPFPTADNDMYTTTDFYQIFVEGGLIEFKDLTFNSDRLTYEYNDQSIDLDSHTIKNLSFSIYKNQLVYFSSFIESGGYPLNAYFLYDVSETPDLPADYFNSDGIITEASEEEWKSALTLNETAGNLFFQERIVSMSTGTTINNIYSYDGDKYYYYTLTIKNPLNENIVRSEEMYIYNKEISGDKTDYVSYTFDFDNQKWIKQTNQEAAYKEHSYQNFSVPFFNDLANSQGKFNYNESRGLYISNSYSDYDNSMIGYAKIHSVKDPSNIESFINNMRFSNGTGKSATTRIITGFAKNNIESIEIPEVK